VPEAGHPELDALFGNWTNGFTLLSMDGSKQKFNASGNLTSSLDPLGNTTTYSYIDADSDGQTEAPSQVVDPWNRSTAFSCTSGQLDTITVFRRAEIVSRNDRGEQCGTVGRLNPPAGSSVRATCPTIFGTRELGLPAKETG
jgi:hypothetical protein